MTTSPFSLLQRYVDPLIEQINENAPPMSNQILDLFDSTTIDSIKVPESGILEFWQAKAMPAIHIGDSWGYIQGDRSLAQGQVKFKKMTISIVMTEDEANRIESQDPTVIEDMIVTQMKENSQYLQTTIEQWAINPWEGVTTSVDYDSLFLGALAPSSTGTLSSPKDMNTTAGTAETWTTSVKISGSNKTVYNVTNIASGVKKLMHKIDAVTKKEFRPKTIYMGVHPNVYDIISTEKDLYNATTKQSSTKSLAADLADMGIIVVQSVWFDSDYAYAEDATTSVCFFADPKDFFRIIGVKPPEGDTWNEWEKAQHTNAGVITYNFEKHKKVEFAVQARSVHVNTSATASTFFKPVVWATITVFDNVD